MPLDMPCPQAVEARKHQCSQQKAFTAEDAEESQSALRTARNNCWVLTPCRGCRGSLDRTADGGCPHMSSAYFGRSARTSSNA